MIISRFKSKNFSDTNDNDNHFYFLNFILYWKGIVMKRSLSCMKKGAKAHIQSIEGCLHSKRHLEEMGFIPGTPVEICRCCSKGPLVVTIRGGKVMLGQEMARHIMVK